MDIESVTPHSELIAILDKYKAKYLINERNVLVLLHHGSEFWLYKYTAKELDDFFLENLSDDHLEITGIDPAECNIDDINQPLFIFQKWRKCIIYVRCMDKDPAFNSICAFEVEALTVKSAIRILRADHRQIESQALCEEFYPVKKSKRTTYWWDIIKVNEEVRKSTSVNVIWDYDEITGVHRNVAGKIKY